MNAMLLRRIVSLRETETPLDLVEMSMPAPAAGELLIKVSACGVCHTELDEIEGRTSAGRERARDQRGGWIGRVSRRPRPVPKLELGTR